MKLRGILSVLIGTLVVASTSAAEALIRREWNVDGVKREGLVHVPSRAKNNFTPLVFVFHGHGGSMRQVAKSMPVHDHWPEAIVVYLQGLPTPGRITDKEGKENGWQAGPGEQGDRDLNFFDAVNRSLRSDYKIDTQRVYATGHSNGGSFTYLLWAKRDDLFAAFAPSGAAAGRSYGKFAPRPVLHIAGEKDELVKFAWQKRMIDSLRRTNRCEAGKPMDNGCTIYESKIGAPVITYIYPGTHRYPSEATALIAEFFKKTPRR